MNAFVNYLKCKLDLKDFTLIRTTPKKIVIFKTFRKYTKCIYVNFFEDYIEIKVDKVFDFKQKYVGIERMLISKEVFYSIDETLNHIQQNIVI